MTLATVNVVSPPAVPRPYQLDGIEWLRDGRRKFLTDEFGLGKTKQAVWASEWPVLVVTRPHLMHLWRREILSCYPAAIVATADDGSMEKRRARLNIKADFYVTSIEMLRTDMHLWFNALRPEARQAGQGIKTFVVDEAHRLRGRNSKQYAGAYEVAKRVERVYLLTATPVYNTPNDLYATLRLLDPERFSSYYKFQNMYLSVVQTPWGPRTVGLKNNKALKGVFAEYAMGRTRAEVKAQLPELQESLVEVEPSREWYEQYERLKHQYRDLYGRRLATQQSVLQVLRGYTQQPKLQAVAELVQDSCVTGTVVFTYHKDLAYAIGPLLHSPVITGDMPPGKREAVARGADFVVATFPSVAEGIDMSHMNNVIFMEHDWQTGLIDQAMNRVHRPGNTAAFTNVYHVVVKRSVDSVLYNTLKKRSVTAEEIVQAALRPFVPGDDQEDAA